MPDRDCKLSSSPAEFIETFRATKTDFTVQNEKTDGEIVVETTIVAPTLGSITLYRGLQNCKDSAVQIKKQEHKDLKKYR